MLIITEENPEMCFFLFRCLFKNFYLLELQTLLKPFGGTTVENI